MKKTPPKTSAHHPAKSKKTADKNPPAAALRLGGQPENDEDARTAGFQSATAEAPRKPSRKGK